MVHGVRGLIRTSYFAREAWDKSALSVKEKMTIAVSVSNEMQLQQKKWNSEYRHYCHKIPSYESLIHEKIT